MIASFDPYYTFHHLPVANLEDVPLQYSLILDNPNNTPLYFALPLLNTAGNTCDCCTATFNELISSLSEVVVHGSAS